MLKIFLCVGAAGMVGGLVNVLFTVHSFVLPAVVIVDGSKTLVPGALGSLIIGGIAALISYALYGPAQTFVMLYAGPPPTNQGTAILTPAALAGAILVGFSGGRWISAESDKQFSHGTSVNSARAVEDLVSHPLPTSLQGPSRDSMNALKKLAGMIQTESPHDSYQASQQLLGQIEQIRSVPLSGH
jgi:hypothetical protein